MSDMDVPVNKPCPKCKKKNSIKRGFGGGSGVHFDVEGRKACGLEGTAKGGIRDVFQRIAESPGVKHTKHAKKFKDKL